MTTADEPRETGHSAGRDVVHRYRVDMTSPAFKQTAYSFYARLRDKDPVCFVRAPQGRPFWLLTRYDDVLSMLKDDRLVKDPLSVKAAQPRRPWVPGFLRPLAKNMLDVDGFVHERLRGLVHKAFTPGRVDALRHRVQILSEWLLGVAFRRGDMDVIADYALPIPTTIIAEMLGIPVEDRDRFHRWSAAAVALNPTGGWKNLKTLPKVAMFLRYVRGLIRRKRAAPADDLLTALVEAEDQGDRLTDDELVAMTFLLIIAGHETTVNLIGNGTLALLQNPGELARLRNEPALLPAAIEELLRYYSPVELTTERWAAEDFELHGRMIKAGDMVFASIASANRDERQFEDPDELDLARSPNRHLAFGLGSHYCLGAALARLEAQVAIATLISGSPYLRLSVSPTTIQWRRGMILRGLEALPVFL